MDAALAFVSEDIKCRGSCYLTGKDSVRALLQGMVKRGDTTEIRDLTVEGDTVTYLYKVFRDGFVVEDNAEGESMQLSDGKIIFWNNLHF